MANSITIWNKGKRTWDIKNSEGKIEKVGPQESVQMEEVAGLKLVAQYPRDLTTTGIASPSFDDLKRREQSIRDREANLDAREKALEEREKTVSEREKALDGPSEAVAEPAAKKPGRTPKADKAE